MIKRSRKALLPILVFFITLALGGAAVFVAQKIKGPKITEEPPKKFAKAPEQPPAPTTPTETEAATPANTCNSTQCECAFTATTPPSPTCTVSANPTSIRSGETTTLTATGSGGTPAYSYAWAVTPTGAPAVTGSGATVTWVAPTVSAQATYTFTVTITDSTSKTGTCNTTVVVQPPLPRQLTCTSVSPAAFNVAPGGTQILTVSATGGRTPYSYSWEASGGTIPATSTTNTATWTAPTTAIAGTNYSITATVRDADGITANGVSCRTVATIIAAATHKICQNQTCTTVAGTGTNQCQTNTDCQVNQKPSCGRLEAVPTAGTAPIKVTFTANGASDPDGTLATYEFDFGDESGTTVSSNSTAHTYQTAGSFEARVWVRDNLSLRSDMTDFCKVKITVGSVGAPAPTPTPTPPTPTPTPPPPGPISTPTPAASPSAAPTGSREMTMLALLGGLVAILLGGWWYARLDPAWQKFEKGLTRFWERK